MTTPAGKKILKFLRKIFCCRNEHVTAADHATQEPSLRRSKGGRATWALKLL